MVKLEESVNVCVRKDEGALSGGVAVRAGCKVVEMGGEGRRKQIPLLELSLSLALSIQHIHTLSPSSHTHTYCQYHRPIYLW